MKIFEEHITGKCENGGIFKKIYKYIRFSLALIFSTVKVNIFRTKSNEVLYSIMFVF